MLKSLAFALIFTVISGAAAADDRVTAASVEAANAKIQALTDQIAKLDAEVQSLNAQMKQMQGNLLSAGGSQSLPITGTYQIFELDLEATQTPPAPSSGPPNFTFTQHYDQTLGTGTLTLNANHACSLTITKTDNGTTFDYNDSPQNLGDPFIDGVPVTPWTYSNGATVVTGTQDLSSDKETQSCTWALVGSTLTLTVGSSNQQLLVANGNIMLTSFTVKNGTRFKASFFIHL